MSPAGGTPVLLVSSVQGQNDFTALSVDNSGNIYYADAVTGHLNKKSAAAGTVTVIASKSTNEAIYGIAVDKYGNVYYSGNQDKYITRLKIATGEKNMIGSNFSTPWAIALDTTGRIYVGCFESNVVRITLGGYFINKNLPAGLSFDSNTGIISGTPTLARAASNYTITASNNSGTGSATINISVTAAPKPVISYPSPQTYTTGVAITPLTPLNTGGAIVATAIEIVGTGFNNPNAVTLDAAGNIYVADGSNNEVKKIPAVGGMPVVIGAGFNGPAGIAADSAGNVYVTDKYNNVVKKIPADGSAIVTVGPAFNLPNAVCLDKNGNIYVCDRNGLKKMPPGGGTPVTIITLPLGEAIVAVTIDSSGNIFYVNAATNQLEEKLATGGSTVIIASEPAENDAITGVAVDATGNIYYPDINYDYITKVTAGTNQKNKIGSGFQTPFGIATDRQGEIYVCDNAANTVSKISVGGYFVNPTLPFGLNLNANTGIISGTPSLASPPTDYTVTAFNKSGTGSTLINISVTKTAKPAISYNSPDVYHQNKKIAALVPANTGGAIASAKQMVLASNLKYPFGIAVDASGNSYCVESQTKDVRMIPAGGGSSVVIGAGFTQPFGIAVDGSGNVFVVDGQGNNSIKKIPANGGAVLTFAFGDFDYRVIAADIAGNIYTVTKIGTTEHVLKFASTGGTPTDLASVGTASPGGIAVDNAGNVYVTDGAGNIMEIMAGTHSAIILATTGSNIITAGIDASGNVYFLERTGHTLSMYLASTGKVIVLADGGVAESYGAAVDANGNIYVTNYFGSNVVKITTSGYYIDIPLPVGMVMDKATGTISGTPTVTSPATTYNVTAINSGGTSSASFSLAVLANSSLSNLVPSVSNLGPPFRAETLDYNMTVASSVSSITFTPTVADAAATITVNGATVASGTASAPIPLTTGDNAVHVVVTATDGSKSTYSVLVTRVPSSNYYLATLLTSNGILSPTFTHLTNNYTTQVGAYVASMTVTPTVVDSTATITVNGTPLASGATSAAIPLIVGVNPINIAVTAQNGTVNTYTINVTRVPSTNAYLMRILLNHGYDVPLFSHLIFNYATPVPNGVSAIKVTPIGAVSSSTITVNGTVVASSTASGDIPLVVGVNNISILVTAQDGVTQNTYTVTVTREPPSLNTVYQPVGVATTNGLNQLNEDGLVVHSGLSPNGDGINDFLLIDGIASYPENKLQIMTRNGQLIFEAKNYDNSTKVFDGHSSKTGTMQLPGTYFYSIDYTVNGVVRHKTGFVVLKY